MAIRKVVVLEFDDSEEVTNSAGEQVPSYNSDEVWEKTNKALWDGLSQMAGKIKLRRFADTPNPYATAKAPEKPAEPTETQIRARHREAVTRSMAAVDKLLTNLPDNVHGIRAEITGLVGRTEIPSAALSAYIRASLVYTVPEPLPQPNVILNFTHQVRITSGGFRGYVPYPEKVTRFLDYFQDNPGIW